MIQHTNLDDVVDQQLSITQQLQDADSKPELANAIVDVSQGLVDGVSSAVYLKRDDQLVQASEEPQSKLECPESCEIDDEILVSYAFRTNEKKWAREFPDAGGQNDGDSEDLSGKIVHPLNDHGALVTGIHEGAFSPEKHQLIETIAASSRTALREQPRGEAQSRDGCTETLRTLTEKSEALFEAESREAISERLCDAIEHLLTRPAAVFLWDEQDGCLRAFSTAGEPRMDGERSTLSKDDPAWDAFAETETRLVTNPESADRDGESTPNESELVVPIGNHGVIRSASTDPDYFDESDVELAELLAANAEAALNRVELEGTVRTQESRIEEQNDRLSDLKRAITIIRGIQNCLVRADNRADILESVCRNLTSHEHIAFAWIGHHAPEEDSLRVDAWSGTGQGFLDYLLNTEHDERTIPETVIDTNDAVTIDSIAKHDSFRPWREPALKRGFQSAVCLPLTWNDHTYGFLEIYGSRPGLFADMTAFLTDVATNIANAINAVERREALVSGQSTELELEISDADDPLFELARRVESRLTVDGIIPRSDGSWLVYLIPDEVDVDSLIEECERFVSIRDVNVIREDGDQALLGLVVSEFTLIETLGDHGATIQSVAVGPDGGTITVTVPPPTDIRAFVESCEETLGSVSLTRRESTRETGALGSLRYDIADIVTEKQFEALQAGYFNGYFEVPREHTGQEIAEKLDVSGPTFQHHIRKATQRILRVVFEDGADS